MYDRLMTHAPYDAWVSFTQQMIAKKGKMVNTIVDLGCGTGEIAIHLQKLGYHVTGVDVSADMLSCANEKAMATPIKMDWIQQDIRKLNGFSNIDLCISYCDVINYITNVTDLLVVFRRVYESLAANGLFIFDIHSLHYAESSLAGHTFTEVTDELVYIWECERGENIGEMYHHLTFFMEENGRDTYQRADEVHHQQVYDITVYEKLLKESGFSKIEFYHDFIIDKEFSPEKSERIFIVAEK